VVTPDGTDYNGIRLNFTGAVPGSVINVRAITCGLGGSVSGFPVPHRILDHVALSGDVPPASTNLTIDESDGAFGTQAQESGSNYFRFVRDIESGAVDFIQIAYNPSNFGGTGSGLNWGSGVMFRVIAALPPGVFGGVNVTPEFVNI
jgi:hypothetical protein